MSTATQIQRNGKAKVKQPPKAVTVDSLELAIQCVRLRAERRRQWLRHLVEDIPKGSNGEVSYHKMVEDVLTGRDNVKDESEWLASQKGLKQLHRQLEIAEQSLAKDTSSRLAFLTSHFGLSPAEQSVLCTCLATSLEPGLERVWSYLQDNHQRGYVTLPLVSRLYGHTQAINSADLSTLLKWRIVNEKPAAKGEPASLELDPWVCNWLKRVDRLDPLLEGHSHIPSLYSSLPNWPLEKLVGTVQHIVQKSPYQKVRIQLKGAEGSGRQSLAALVADQFRLPLLVVDVGLAQREEWESLYLHAQRQAHLMGFALGWRGEELPNLSWPSAVPPVQLQFTFMEGDEVPQQQAEVVDVKAELPQLSISDRHKLWQELVPESQEWDQQELQQLVMRYPATVGQIAKTGRHSVAGPQEASRLLRESQRHQLGKLAQLLSSQFTWTDLSLHPLLVESLQDFVFEAKDRERWWESAAASRLFPQGKGLMALFSGPSGTGKTMTAQVIASSLDLDLYRVDLSSVISKYVGETSKHIDRILTKARSMHAVLLFDEADTLFGKRTEIKDAHDRFANADTNYLLQAIENYPGVVILATNRKSNIDSAFVRRIRFAFEFTRPDAAQRMQLWQQLIAEIASTAAARSMTGALGQMAQMLDLTGAQIKYAVLAAVFVARREGSTLSVQHLLKGVERELAKEGKGLSPETAQRMGGLLS